MIEESWENASPYSLSLADSFFRDSFQKEILGIEAVEERVKPGGSPCGEDPRN